MKVREHTYVAGKCLWCGAKDVALLIAAARARGDTDDVEPDTRTCIERDDYSGRLRPEPARRLYACEDADTITGRIAEIEAERRPKCPVTRNDLHACLRTSSRCGEHCPHRDIWVGPEPDAAGAYC